MLTRTLLFVTVKLTDLFLSLLLSILCLSLPITMARFWLDWPSMSPLFDCSASNALSNSSSFWGIRALAYLLFLVDAVKEPLFLPGAVAPSALEG